jgi:hypothetical protein
MKLLTNKLQKSKGKISGKYADKPAEDIDPL